MAVVETPVDNAFLRDEQWYPSCTTARALLHNKDLSYEETDVSSDIVREQDMIERSQRRIVPEVFIDKSAHG